MNSSHGDGVRKVLITAGASGIGYRIAQTLANTGAQVAICDINERATEKTRERHPDFFCVACDAATPDAVQRFVEQAAQSMGGIDTVVANAGSAGPTARVEDIDPAEWDLTVRVNLSSQFYLAKAAIPYLKKHETSSFVSISSAAGRLGYPTRSPYSAAKWGVVGFVQTLAMELGEFGVRVNAILPGSVEGDRMKAILDAKAVQAGTTYEEALAHEVQNVSMRRMIDAEEVADIIEFLTSSKGRSISGQSIGVCGNYETLR